MAQPYRLLYIDDEVENLTVFKAAFKREFDITTLTSALEGLEVLKSQSFDLIIVDQRMPDLTGVEFLERISGDHVDAIRILLTGYSDIKAIIDAINKGRIYYYCTKPWKKEELRIVFLKALEYAQLIKRNKELVKDLSKTIQELEVFLYRASHDLKSPITSQLGLLDLLKREIGDAGNVYVSKIEDSIKTLQQTIEKMQLLSSLSHDFLKESFNINIEELINNSLEKSKDAIKGKSIVVTRTITPASNYFNNKASVQIILDNILENAVRYSAASPEISIAAGLDSKTGMLAIVVRDNGIGISSSALPHVFDAFFRGTNTSSGSGLGLFVAKKLCAILHAEIDVISDGNSGTTVKVQIPNLVPA